MSHAILTVDLGFGDAGKGAWVDYFTRLHTAHTVIRYNGGGQAGHRVVTCDGREHIFSQFGSGTLAGAQTFLSRFMLINPLSMEAEAAHLCTLGIDDPWSLVQIDRRAPVVTPFQRAVNRLREQARGAGRHGSCGMGIGETMADWLQYGEQTLLAGDLADSDQMQRKLIWLRRHNLEKVSAFAPALPNSFRDSEEWQTLIAPGEIDWLLEVYSNFAQRVQIVPGETLHAILHQPGTVIFEGAQGVLLDEWYGFHPHTTWSTTTLANACALLHEANYNGKVNRLGLTRSYSTRHGAGPLPTEEAALGLADARNGAGPWQGAFRIGWLDGVLLRYAREVVGRLDGVLVSCLDRVADRYPLPFCTAYETKVGRLTTLPHSFRSYDLEHQAQLTALLQMATPIYTLLDSEVALLAKVEEVIGAPVWSTSHGPTAADKVERKTFRSDPQLIAAI